MILKDENLNVKFFMPILITGGSGFIAVNLAEALLKLGEEVVLFSRHSPPKDVRRFLDSLGGRYQIVLGDVRSRERVEGAFRDFQVDRVFHAAVITADAERERRDSRSIIEVNLLGTIEVLEAARRNNVRRFVYLSSSSVYGENAFDSEYLDEGSTIPIPDTLYAITKYAGEKAGLRFKELWGMDVIAARVGTVFGPWERNTGVRDTLSAPMQATQLAMRGKDAILPREGRRDWAYSRDVADALIGVLNANLPHYEVYNIGPGVVWTIEAWCKKLMEVYPRFSYSFAISQEEANVSYYSPRDRAPFSIERVVEDIGFRPRFGFQEAFSDYMEWIKQFPDFWKGNYDHYNQQG